MQYVIRAANGYFVRDDRSRRPSYAHFDLVSRDVCTVSPNIAAAKEMRAACYTYCDKYGESGLAPTPGKLTLQVVR